MSQKNSTHLLQLTYGIYHHIFFVVVLDVVKVGKDLG